MKQSAVANAPVKTPVKIAFPVLRDANDKSNRQEIKDPSSQNFADIVAELSADKVLAVSPSNPPQHGTLEESDSEPDVSEGKSLDSTSDQAKEAQKFSAALGSLNMVEETPKTDIPVDRDTVRTQTSNDLIPIATLSGVAASVTKQDTKSGVSELGGGSNGSINAKALTESQLLNVSGATLNAVPRSIPHSEETKRSVARTDGMPFNNTDVVAGEREARHESRPVLAQQAERMGEGRANPQANLHSSSQQSDARPAMPVSQAAHSTQSFTAGEPTFLAPSRLTNDAVAASSGEAPRRQAPNTITTVPILAQMAPTDRPRSRREPAKHIVEEPAQRAKIQNTEMRSFFVSSMSAIVPKSQSAPARLAVEGPLLTQVEAAASSTWEPGSVPGSAATASHRPETPLMVSRQIAEVFQRMPDRPVDLSLNPEELGRVRLSISAADNGITVNILAERIETLELLRRNIDLLGQEFRALGYDDISFSFGKGASSDEGNDSKTTEQHQRTSLDLALESETSNVGDLALDPKNGIDIRL